MFWTLVFCSLNAVWLLHTLKWSCTIGFVESVEYSREIINISLVSQVSWCVENFNIGIFSDLWTCMGWNKRLPPFMSLPVMGEIAGVNTAPLGRSSWFEEKGQMGGRVPQWTQWPHVWPGERWALVRLYFAHDSPCDENKQPYHAGSVVAQVNKDHAFRCTPGWRCQVYYWCIIKDLWKRQHHHRHMEHKDNTQNGQVQLEHPLDSVKWDGRTLLKQPQRKDTRFKIIINEKKPNLSSYRGKECG